MRATCAIIVTILYAAFPPCTSKQTACVQNGKFYRDPDVYDCSKYFLCVEGDVFEFRCTDGLRFDVERQICDSEFNATDCVSNSQLKKCSNQIVCTDGTCLPHHYLCDGSIDCQDGSDEIHCDDFKDPHEAGDCDPSKCILPDCYCSKNGKSIPGNLKSSDVPQMILLSFENAVNSDNWNLYTELFTTERRNPNDCPITATFFISHPHNDYQKTQKLWNDGHEIAVHSITHRGPEEWWSEKATIEDWFDEMVGQANILNRFANIPMHEIRGLRVPYFQIGHNRQFLAMKEFGFVYDSTVIAPFANPPFWPYTLDYKIPHNCSDIKRCPGRSYPGLWELVLNPLQVGENVCSTLNSCQSILNEEQIFQTLVRNFNRHYLTNKAPFGVHLNSDWFKNPAYLKAFQRFLDDMMSYPDVWFVTNFQAIQWIKSMVSIDEVDAFELWNCKRQFNDVDIACDEPNVCNLKFFQRERHMNTCNKCPETYPWIKNEFGRKFL